MRAGGGMMVPCPRPYPRQCPRPLFRTVPQAHRGGRGGWVGWRLAELLPLSEQQRLQLLQMDDPHERLQQLLGWMP